jgi:hypothetical protein
MQEFSKFLFLFSRIITSKEKVVTNYIEKHQRKLVRIGEPMVPNQDMAGCFPKSVPSYNMPTLSYNLHGKYVSLRENIYPQGKHIYPIWKILILKGKYISFEESFIHIKSIFFFIGKLFNQETQYLSSGEKYFPAEINFHPFDWLIL